MERIMNGLCDVQGCNIATYMCWRPLSERRGRQICEYHWNRHKDETDSFDLYEAFKFRRPVRISRRLVKTETHRCDCGRELQAGHKFCPICAKERERQRKRQSYHERKKPKPEPIVQENILKCRACGGTRKPGYTYCPKCSRERQRQANRERQRRHYRKRMAG
jgi:hypothetical protein